MNIKKLFLSLVVTTFLVTFFSCSSPRKGKWVAEAPADTLYTHIDTAGVTVIPNGRLITPPGKSFRVAPHPFGLVLSRDGKIAVTVNSGVRPLSVTILKNIDTDHPQIIQIPPGAKNDEGVLASVFMGLAISPDDSTLYVANVGMFEYKPYRGVDPQNLKETAPSFPPVAFGTKEAEEGIHTDTLDIPGLGNPNVPESFSVWKIDLADMFTG